MYGYIPPTTYPVTVINGIRCDYDEHKNRKPASKEPGTDYATPMNTPLVAVGDGVIADVNSNNSAGTGRWLRLNLSNGQSVRYLHLNSIAKKVGTKVKQGEVIAYSGNSGGVGSHVHISLFNSPNDPFKNAIDFEDYIGGSGANVDIDNGSNPIPVLVEEDEMTATFINIQGKSGSHRGGTYAIMRSNSGILFARFVQPEQTPGIPTVPNAEYEAWAKTMPIA